MSAYPDGWRGFVLHTPPDQTALLSKVSNSSPTISKLAIHAAPNFVSFPQFLKSILHGIWLCVKSEQDRRRAMTCDQQWCSKSGPPVAKKIGKLVGCMQPPCPHDQRESPDDFTARRTPYECRSPFGAPSTRIGWLPLKTPWDEPVRACGRVLNYPKRQPWDSLPSPKTTRPAALPNAGFT